MKAQKLLARGKAQNMRHFLMSKRDIWSICGRRTTTNWKVKMPVKCGIKLGPVRTTRNFVCFAKKSVNAKPFSVRTIFFVHENFVKRHQTSKRPSSTFGGLQFFVKRENLLFRDSYPATGRHIL